MTTLYLFIHKDKVVCGVVVSIKNKLVFVKQKDYNDDESVVTLKFDLSCEKTRNHIRQLSKTLSDSVKEYESLQSEKGVSAE